jgi:PAS domain-containing protein
MTSMDRGIREPDEKQLQDAHREAEFFINAVPSILIGLDSDGRIKRWNDAAVRTFGLPKEDVLGKTLANCGLRRNRYHPTLFGSSLTAILISRSRDPSFNSCVRRGYSQR